MKTILNVVGFQICWVAFVGGAGHGMWWIGVPLLAIFATWQIAVSATPRSDRSLIVLAALLGFVVDTAFLKSGMLTYASPEPWGGNWAPAWMTGLWIGFALTLNHSMSFLRRRHLLGFVLGAIAGPLAYWAAAHAWSALIIHEPVWQAMVALAVAWGVLTPVLVAVAVRMNAGEPAPSVASA